MKIFAFVSICLVSAASLPQLGQVRVSPPPAPVVSWTQVKGRYCYNDGSKSAVVIGPEEAVTASNCQLICQGNPDCTGIMVTHGPATSNVDCWILKDIVLDNCAKNDGYDIRFKHVSQPCPDPKPQPSPYGPGKAEWSATPPECVGLSQSSLDEANMFINDNVVARQCLLVVKEGKIAYEWYGQGEDPPLTSQKCEVKATPRFATARMCSGAPSQSGWSYDAKANAVKFSDGCLDASIDTDLQMKPCTGSPSQQFTYVLSSKALQASDGRCVDIKQFTTGEVQLLACNGLKNQQFQFNNNGTVCDSCDDQNKRCLEVTDRDPSFLQGTCSFNETFGCAGSNSMWVSGNCKGQFKCNGRDVECFNDVTDPSSTTKKICQCDPENKPFAGYSMTKSIGAFILFLATDDGLDLDADITASYGIPSPRPYPVTCRMMMSQIIGGEHGPGELWRYDELGDMWMHLFPKIVLAATGRNASYYMDVLHTELGLSEHSTWPDVNTKWYRGAAFTCRDWARFGQLMLNGGYWGKKQLINGTYFEQMQQPVKHSPYNEYSNPCYGLLVWLNADKRKHPGCCWEASRLPNPKCNEDTFMPGAVTDMTLVIGLYGRLLMTLPSAKTVIVGMGTDLRPIEPARIGYYPGLCKALGLPCNTPPPVPKPRCGERLECTGISAQCFAGGAWNHSEPHAGKMQCVRCFQNRLPMYEQEFPEAHDMVKRYCPQDPRASMDFLNCFCFKDDANPFSPWPTTTTTTIAPSPIPHPTPSPGPTTTRPLPPPCEFSLDCVAALEGYSCKRNAGDSCFSCLNDNQAQLTAGGCPNFKDKNVWAKSFCWCGRYASAEARGNYTDGAEAIVI